MAMCRMMVAAAVLTVAGAQTQQRQENCASWPPLQSTASREMQVAGELAGVAAVIDANDAQLTCRSLMGCHTSRGSVFLERVGRHLRSASA